MLDPHTPCTPVPNAASKEWSTHAGVCRLCFSAESTAKHGRTVASFREPFERDLNPLTPGFPTTLGELALRLKTWRTRLQNTLDETMPACLHLEAESRNLQVGLILSFCTRQQTAAMTVYSRRLVEPSFWL